MLKQKLLSPILQAIFPVLVADPPPGKQDPEDDEDDDGTKNDNPKHCAAQVVICVDIQCIFLLCNIQYIAAVLADSLWSYNQN